MAAKTECDKCKKVFDSIQEGSSCVSMITHGKVEHGRGVYANCDFCPVCTESVNERLEEILYGNS